MSNEHSGDSPVFFILFPSFTGINRWREVTGMYPCMCECEREIVSERERETKMRAGEREPRGRLGFRWTQTAPVNRPPLANRPPNL